jgi:hypothetical protein
MKVEIDHLKEKVMVGVIADTHVPDRVPVLHPSLLPGLRAARVNLILHLGDICVPRVLGELGLIAPVIAVRGNRDWLFIGKLPWRRLVEIGEIKVSMQHGQGTFFEYWLGKFFHVTAGYQVENYLPRLVRTSPAAKVILFGHTHYPECFTYEERLLMNPGSASVRGPGYQHPTYGLLTITQDGQVSGEIVALGK